MISIDVEILMLFFAHNMKTSANASSPGFHKRLRSQSLPREIPRYGPIFANPIRRFINRFASSHLELCYVRDMKLKFLLLVFFVVFSFVSQSQDCTLKKVKDGISVYTCEVADSKLKALRVELTLSDTKMEDLIALLADVKGYINWQYKIIECDVLKEISEREVVYRTVMEAPWPASDREMIVDKQTDYDSTTQILTVIVKSIPYDYPEDDDLVRVPFSEAVWKVASLKNDLKVVYALRVNPGGSIPSWIINLGIAEGPLHSFGYLRDALEKKK
jgi:hypothetical protein